LKISVVIPTFNRKGFVQKALESVLNQTVEVDEIIIVDDGSNDNTRENLKNNSSIKYIYQENSGVSSARNKGIFEAKNDWIAFLDSDDIWHEEKIEKQIQLHLQNDSILISHTDELWNRNNKIIKQKHHQLKPSGFCFLDNIPSCKIGPSTTLLHKSILEDVGYFDEELIVCEDYDLWLRILHKYELGYLDEKLITKYAGHENQLSFSTFAIDKYRIQALEKHLKGEYSIEIKKEILKKCAVLLKGAHKHNNLDIISVYEKKVFELNNI